MPKDSRGGCILPALCGHDILRRLPGSDPSGSQGQFLGEQPQGLKLFIQPGKFTAQDVLVTAFLFLQCLDLHDPPLHGGGTAAARLDEVVRALLVLRDLLFDRQIELLGHLVALLGVVDEVEAVGEQWGIVAVEPTDLLDERLEYHHLLHGVPGHEIEMPVDTDLGSVQRPQELQADGLDLFAVGACLVEFKELLGLNAILHGVHILIVGEVVVAKPLVSLVVVDIRQFLILVGALVHRLLYQFPGEYIGRALILPAVDLIKLLLTVPPDGDAVPDVPGGAFEGVGHRQALPAGAVHTKALTQRLQLLFIHQDIGEGEVQKLAQHIAVLAGRCADDITEMNGLFQKDFLLK